VGVDLSARDDAVWGSLDAQSTIVGGHGGDGIDEQSGRSRGGAGSPERVMIR
jgi:hypothetical protein